MTIALIGNPNCGKTTLFNALTGSRQRVGNWPGVTVDRKSGEVNLPNGSATLVDLPGIYSLVSCHQDSAIDERIANDYLRSGEVDVILNIIDASNLERHLYLTMQCLELGIPMVVALNMMDVAKQRRLTIDTLALSEALGVPVIPMTANKQQGLATLLETIEELQQTTNKTTTPVQYPEPIPTLLHQFMSSGLSREVAMLALEGDSHAAEIAPEFETEVHTPDILIADARYSWIHALCQRVIQRASEQQLTLTAKIDRIVLHRWFGIPVFLAAMYSLFLVSINFGGVFQDAVDMATDAIFVQGFAGILQFFGAPHSVVAILAYGFGRGINTTLTFIPVILSLFFCLAFLEDSGYMARAAFVMDRLMQSLGLPGKSFIPMIIGFGCNVPAIMAARTLEHPRDRILTILMTPFMSCSARLAIFSVFAAAFFPRGAQNIVFSLYLLGISVAILTGYFLRRTILQGKPAPFVMELPPYHIPTWTGLWRSAWTRATSFIHRAGKVILPLSLVLGALNEIPYGDTDTLLSVIGQTMTTIFAPLGITQSNWPATVGLLTGTLAKEVVVGTLNTLYSQSAQLASMLQPVDILTQLKQALMTIPANLAALPDAIFNPIAAAAPGDRLNSSVYGIMVQSFQGPAAAFAYCVFVLLYVPCVSTMAVIRRELSSQWMWFSILWSTGLAYLLGVMTYQCLTLLSHPQASIIWLVAMSVVFALGLFTLKRGAATC